MKIAVIGAGIIGVTTAHELVLDGHDVTVLERRSAVAEEASFANAGIAVPDDLTPWGGSGMPSRLLGQLFSGRAPIRLGSALCAADLSWGWQWLRAGQSNDDQYRRASMQSLAHISQQLLHQTRDNLKLDYDHSTGYLLLLRSEKDRRLLQADLQSLRDSGTAFHEIDAAGALRLEPALNPDTALFGAIHVPGGEVANCRQFALLLKNASLRLGVRYQFNCNIRRLEKFERWSLHVNQAPEVQSYDAVVLCAGIDTGSLLQGLDLVALPMAAVRGYSVSATIREPLNAPRSAIMDQRYKIAITRLGNRIRVAGGAELGGDPVKKRADTIKVLYRVLQDWFPGAANLANGVQEWKGARPTLPDGAPVIGSSGIDGLWLNVGHGANGWALACGSARLVADMLNGDAPALDPAAFSVDRFKT